MNIIGSGGIGTTGSEVVMVDKKATVKEILDNMSHMLTEMSQEVRMISSAIYKGCEPERPREDALQETPTMLDEIRWQRDTIANLLQDIADIRGVLW